MDLTLIDDKWMIMSVDERRRALMDLEESSRDITDECGIEIEPLHFHASGVYAREIHVPKGATIVGEIHLHDQINVLSKGKIRVATEEGIMTLEAPYTFISPAGTKRAGFVLEDTVWTVFHATSLTDQQEIRQEFIAPSYEALDKQLESRQHGMVGDGSNSSINNIQCDSSKESSEEGGQSSR